MATYNPTQLGIKPPTGGFQTGGWYNGRQYWNGTLSDPGVIHPDSNQTGAGQVVSKEVNAQTSVAAGLTPNANQDYIDAQNRLAKQNPVAPVATNPTTSTDGANMGASGAGLGIPTGSAPELNLPDTYKNLYDNSGITALQDDLSAKEKAFIEAKAKIGDNPWLSEATRLGRVAKLETLYGERTASLKNDIAVKKADIETQLNLQTKQFDINSQQAKANLDKLNTLIGLGALNSASGEDIANLVRSTGLSSTIIQSAINASKSKDVKTQVVTSTADNGTVTVSVINTQTGEVIKQSSLGKVGNQQNGGTTGTSSVVLNQAVNALDQADVIGQKPKFAGDVVKGDKLLSKEEADIAYNSILALVNGDKAKADALFLQAWNYGQYQTWKP